MPLAKRSCLPQQFYMRDINLKKNDVIELKITDITVNSEGAGRYNGFAFFVKDALPGDEVRAVVTKINKGYGYAKTLEIISPSKDRVLPACPLARKCGGCQLMELDYKSQLRLKENRVQKDLEKLGGLSPDKFRCEPVIAMDADCPLHFRNKVQLPFGRDKNGRVICGFYAGRTHCIVETKSCPAAFEEADILTAAAVRFIEENALSVYDEKTKKGLVRHILLRKAFGTGQIMVCLVAHPEYKDEAKDPGIIKIKASFAREIRQACPDVKSVCLNINTKNTNVILGEKTLLLGGKDYIEDTIEDLVFHISAPSFFQVNPAQTKKLYAKALEYAALTGKETVWDLYCGTGTISLFLARAAKQVFGIETVPAAIENAKENTALNKIENAQFFCGKAEELFRGMCEGNADVVVLDPPRKGCEKALLESLLEVCPERIVYVSCSSATLARDIKFLSGKYELTAAAPCDMFPHTNHCEVVTCLRRKAL